MDPVGRQALVDVTNTQPWPEHHDAGHRALAGSKRKADNDAPLATEPREIDLAGVPMDKSCNQVRGQIRRFLDSGEMKVGEFCKAIGVSNKSLNDFLRQNGPDKGAFSSSYDLAWAFFKRRELAGVKMPSKKAKVASGKSSGAKGSAQASAQTPDISQIHLDGEQDRSVKVFDSCDEIRKKINAHLKKPGVTQAQFCRDLVAQLPGTDKVQGKQLTDFRSKKGPTAGNTSCVFYGAYVYFEKVRLAENKPVSKHRQEMQKAWPQGFDLERGSGHVWCSAYQQPYEDSLGRVTLV